MNFFTPYNKSNFKNFKLQISDRYNKDNINSSSLYNSMNIRRANGNELYRKIKRLSNSKTFENIYKNETDWSKDIINYETEKKNLKWGRNPPVRYFTKLYINSEDRIFNPITQKFTNKLREENLRQNEKNDLINSIAKGYDNEINESQYFNIINWQDKLKGFENDINYPKSPRVRRKKYFNILSKNYNILSNIDINSHHFDKPENRPKIFLDNTKNSFDFNDKSMKRNKIIITRGLKDYNILSNEYYENTNEKKNIDLEINLLNSAKKFYKSRLVNPITGIYYNEEKEKEKNIQDKKKLNLKKFLINKKEALYNPFNLKIYDKDKLEEKDRINMNKIARYKIRNHLENYYRENNNLFYEKYMKSLKNKLSYDRYKPSDDRAYDILNHEEILNLVKYKKDNNCRTPWKLIKEGSNEHETLSKSLQTLDINKDDIHKRYAENKIKREKLLKKLPRFDSDPLFKIKKNIRKINFELDKPKKIIKNNSLILDKKKWFNLKISKK